ncbi:5'-methylthioadenosine/adenosylhomocysteine nucleosidase [Caproiciproducens sp. LBM24188]
MVGIIGAMAVEVENILKKMTGTKQEKISGITYYMGKIENRDCVVAQCGIGKVAAAVCAQTMILKYSPVAVINVGVAGGIGEGIHIGDLVVSSGLVQHDIDTTALGDPMALISGLNLVTIPASERLVRLVEQVGAESYDGGVHIGVIASGDQFISGKEKLNQLARDYEAKACEMEGGSIAQVCYMNQVEFVVIRAISDNANEDASVDYATFSVESAHKTAELIDQLVQKLS